MNRRGRCLQSKNKVEVISKKKKWFGIALIYVLLTEYQFKSTEKSHKVSNTFDDQIE